MWVGDTRAKVELCSSLCAQLIVVHAVQFAAGHCLALRPQNAEVAGDGLGGQGVVAGDHDGAQPGAARCLDRHARLGSGGVDDADQRQQRQITLDFGRQGFRHSVQRAPGDADDAQSLLRHVVDGLAPYGPTPVIEGLRALGRGLLCGPVQQLVGRALGDGDEGRVREDGGLELAVDLMDRGHGLAFAAEGQFGDAGQVALQFLASDAGLARGDQQGALGRVADHIQG